MSIRILVADDEPNQLELLTYNLTQADFEVIRAEDGQQALDMIDEHRPDLVIIDWMMPHISGIDVCRTLRSRSETKRLPIIILSAMERPDIVRRARAVGCEYYVRKPYDPNVLLTLIEHSLEASL